MSDNKTLNVELRTEDFGSRGAKRLVRAGRIPAVIYGKNNPVHITLDAKAFTHKFKTITESTVLTLVCEGKEYSCLLKDYQEEILKDRLTHVDFFEITKGQTLRTFINVTLEGSSIGVREGGLLEQIMHEVEVECLPKDLVEHIVVDVTDLELNSSLRAGEIKLPKGMKLHTDETATVATIKIVKEVASESTEEPESEATVEVIKQAQED